MKNKELILEIVSRLKNILMLTAIPIFFTFLFGYMYSGVFVEKIPMAVLDMDNTHLSRTIVNEFKNSPGFKVTYYAESEIELEEAIKTKKAYTGIMIPKNFSDDVKELKAPKTLFIVDGCNMVIGNNAISYGSTILNTLNIGAQMNILQGKGMVPYTAESAIKSLSFVDRMLYDPQLSYIKYLFIGIAGIMVQQTVLGVLAPILISERRKMLDMKLHSKQGIKKFLEIGLRILVTTVLTFVGFTLVMYCIGKYFNFPLRGSIYYTYVLLFIFILDLIGMSFFLSALFGNEVHCVQFCMFLSVPTILTSAYVWPEYMMPNGFAAIVKHVWPLIYFINPVRDMHIKGSGLNSIYPYIQGGIKYAVIWITAGVGLYVFKLYTAKKIREKLLKLQQREENIAEPTA